MATMLQTGKTYSFADVTANILGPGIVTSLGYEAGVAEEGISLEPEGQKTKYDAGADGGWMYSLRVVNPAIVTVRLLKTSNVNSKLMTAYNLQRLTSLTWGQNIITIKQHVASDTIILQGCAFENPPSLEYGTNGGINVWKFLVGRMTIFLGEYEEWVYQQSQQYQPQNQQKSSTSTGTTS